MVGSHPDRNKLKRLFEKCYFSIVWRCFVTKSVKFGRAEVSIVPIDAKIQDLSLRKGPRPYFFCKIYSFCQNNLQCLSLCGGPKSKKREIVDETGLDG